jgi:hypothetical protein
MFGRNHGLPTLGKLEEHEPLGFDLLIVADAILLLERLRKTSGQLENGVCRTRESITLRNLSVRGTLALRQIAPFGGKTRHSLSSTC